MDSLRKHLDELMGKDRNMSLKEKMEKNERYYKPDVYFIFNN